MTSREQMEPESRMERRTQEAQSEVVIIRPTFNELHAKLVKARPIRAILTLGPEGLKLTHTEPLTGESNTDEPMSESLYTSVLAAYGIDATKKPWNLYASPKYGEPVVLQCPNCKQRPIFSTTTGRDMLRYPVRLTHAVDTCPAGIFGLDVYHATKGEAAGVWNLFVEKRTKRMHRSKPRISRGGYSE
jgi:hypothetical protein